MLPPFQRSGRGIAILFSKEKTKSKSLGVRNNKPFVSFVPSWLIPFLLLGRISAALNHQNSPICETPSCRHTHAG
jgi:hypothetical protein